MREYFTETIKAKCKNRNITFYHLYIISDEEGGIMRRRGSNWRRRSHRRTVSNEPIGATKKTIVEASGEEDNTDIDKAKEPERRRSMSKTGILEFTPIRAGQDVTPANFHFRDAISSGITRGRHLSGKINFDGCKSGFVSYHFCNNKQTTFMNLS